MLGEKFFKENGDQQILEDDDSEDDDTEEIPYSVLEQYKVGIIFALHSPLILYLTMARVMRRLLV